MFQCVLDKKPMNIPTEIPADYVKKVESIISTSSDHSETFSSVSTLINVFHFTDMNLIALIKVNGELK